MGGKVEVGKDTLILSSPPLISSAGESCKALGEHTCPPNIFAGVSGCIFHILSASLK